MGIIKFDTGNGIVEAFKLTEGSIVEVIMWLTECQSVEVSSEDDGEGDGNVLGLFIETGEGRKLASLGDWIFKSEDNTFSIGSEIK